MSRATDSPDLDDLIVLLGASLDDLRLSDDEKRSLADALRRADPPEEGRPVG